MRRIAVFVFVTAGIAAAQVKVEFEESFERSVTDPQRYAPWEVLREEEGYPRYNTAEISRDRAHTGSASARLRSLGQAVGYRTRTGTLEADPARSYSLTAWAMMTRGERNLVAVALVWYDARGVPLRLDRSPGIAARHGWTRLTLNVNEPPPRAVYVTIRLIFEGPDVSAEAYFDSVRLISQPFVTAAASGREVPVYFEGEPVRVAIQARGLAPGVYTAALSVNSVYGTAVRRAATPFVVEPSFEGLIQLAGQAMLHPNVAWIWEVLQRPVPRPQPILFDLGVFSEAGYYDLVLEIRSQSGTAAVKTVPLLVFSPFHFGPDRGRSLGLSLNPYTTHYRGLSLLVRAVEPGASKIVLWDNPSLGRATVPTADEVRELIRALRESPAREAGVTGVFKEMPQFLFGPRERHLIGLLSHDAPNRLRRLKETARNVAEAVERWQFGGDGDEDLWQRPRLDEVLLRDAAAALREVNRSALIGLAAPAARQAAASVVRTPDYLALHVADLRDVRPEWKRPQLTLAPRTHQSVDRYDGIRRDIAAFMQMMIQLAELGLVDPSLTLPYDGSHPELVDPHGFPGWLLVPMKVANDLLSRTRPVALGSVFEEPIRSVVLEKQDTGEAIIAAWSDEPQLRRVYLGAGVTAIDSLGRRWSLEPGAELRIDRLPVFLLGVNPTFLRTLMSVELTDQDFQRADPAVELKESRTVKGLRLKNHFPQEMENLTVSFEEAPTNWALTPPLVRMGELAAEPADRTGRIRPGAAAGHLFEVRVPPTEEGAGPRTIMLRLRFKVGGLDFDARLFRSVALTPVIGVELQEQTTPSPTRRRVILKFTNHSARSLNLAAVIRLPGEGEVRPVIAGLRPKETRELEYLVSIDVARHVEVRVGDTSRDRYFGNYLFELRK